MSSTERRRPTRTSTTVAVAVALGVVAALLLRVDVPRFLIGMSAVGLLCLAGSLRFVESGPTDVDGFVVSLLAVPVALGFFGGLFGTTLVLTGAQFPVPTDAEISLALLRIAGNLGVILGCTLAVFGLALGYRNVLAATTLTRYTWVTAVTAVVPLLVGIVLSIRVILAGNPRATESIVGAMSRQMWTVLVNPSGPHLHLGSFLFVFTITGGAILLFVDRAPVAELLWDGDGLAGFRTVERVRWWLYVAVTVSAALMVGAVLLEVWYSPRELESQFGSGLFGAIQFLTTAGWLRILLLGLALAAVGWLVLEVILGQYTSYSESGPSALTGPLVGGALLTGVAWSISEPAFRVTLRETTIRLPDPLAASFQDALLPIANIYGETTVVVFAAGLLLGLVAWLALLLRGAVYFEYLTSEGAGFSITSAGLLFAAIWVSITAPPSWLIFLTVAAALVVWDLGRFGTHLAREVGTGETRRVEVVHTAATVLVGVLAVAGAMVLESRAAETSFRPSPTAALALVCLIVALVAFSVVLRDVAPSR